MSAFPITALFPLSLSNARLCTQTPTAGARVFEEGDKKLLKLVHAAKSKYVDIVARAHCH